MPIYSTQIVRLDGLMLFASIENNQSASELEKTKGEIRQLIRRMNTTSEPRAAIETGDYKIHYYRPEDLVFFAITERSFPKELAAMYLDDIASEFLSTHKPNDYRRGDLRPYAFNEFDTFVQRSKKSYENPRASNNLDKVNAQLKETTQIMSKNLEDLLYRGDSLDKMSSMSSDLRESSKKYKRAAVRINWQLLLQQYGLIAGLIIFVVFIMVFMIRRLFW
ncbi:SNAP receptor [Taxawa tesnikishii (nom. ined.)]|nr:SNAP receptor [Dothideales sp. JES 119]